MKIARIAAVIVFVLAAFTACSLGDLKPCSSSKVRTWCKIVVSRTTWENIAAKCPVVDVPVAVTQCSPKGGNKDKVGAMLLFFNTVQDLINLAYKTVLDDGAVVQYVEYDGNLYSAKFGQTTSGGVACTVGETNPYDTSIVMDLDSNAKASRDVFYPQDVSSQAPTLKPQTGGAGGGDTAEDDCTSCVTEACPTMDVVDDGMDTCIHDHCAAVCPSGAGDTCSDSSATGLMENCAPAGATCGNGSLGCCSSMVCYVNDTGVGSCM